MLERLEHGAAAVAASKDSIASSDARGLLFSPYRNGIGTGATMSWEQAESVTAFKTPRLIGERTIAMRRILFTFSLLFVLLAAGNAETKGKQKPQEPTEPAVQEPAGDGSDYDVDNNGTVKSKCPRTCSREVPYCTEVLADGKCKLWGSRTEYFCCPE